MIRKELIPIVTLNNLTELEKYLQLKIKHALENEVSDVARKELKEHIIDDVYAMYAPTQYQRTGELYQDKNIETIMVNNNTLSIRSTREENGKDIARIIEDGVGYTWEDSKIYAMQPYPRPFHDLTAKELDEKGIAKNALKRGLIRQGLEVK